MRRIATIAAALTAVVALGAGAAAATAADTPTQPSLIDTVAAQLGVTPDKLRDAFKGALDARIDAAVTSGKLTKDQGDKLKQRIADANGLGLGARQHFRDRLKDFRERLKNIRPKVVRGKALAPIAAYLGLSPEDLRAKLRGGTRLVDLVPSDKLPGLVDVMLKPAKDRLAKAVSDGKLTQQRADEILAKLKTHTLNALTRQAKKTP